MDADYSIYLAHY